MNFEANLGRYASALHHLLTKQLNEQLEKARTNITADQFRLLTHLWRQEGITQQQMATCLNRDRAGVTRMADILENQGLIKRMADQDDRRVNLLFLTEAGKDLEKTARECAQKTLDILCQGFSEAEKQSFEALFLKGIKNLMA
jgi:DNA-binding MarR family transcriptional regulator